MGKKSEIARSILEVIGTAGLVLAVLALPGLPGALAPFLKKRKKQYNRQQIQHSLGYLVKNGFLSISKESDKTAVKLTEEGRKKLNSFKFDDLKIEKPKKWDHKWRMVIFDIPLSKSVNRTIFARKLKELGFYQMQKSVWITPFPCEFEVEYLKEIYEIGPFVRTAIADSFDIQIDLLKKFNLSD